MVIRIWQLPRVVAHERFNYIKSPFYLQLISYITRYLESRQKLHSSTAGTVCPLSAKRIIIMRSLISRRKERSERVAKLDTQSSRGISCLLVVILRYLRIRKFPTARARLHWTNVMLTDCIRWYSTTDDRVDARRRPRVARNHYNSR